MRRLRGISIIVVLVILQLILVGCVDYDGPGYERAELNVVQDIKDFLESEGLVGESYIGYEYEGIHEKNTRVSVDGEILQFDERFSTVSGDARTIIYEDRTLVPLREISGVAGFGIEVDARGKKPLISIIGDTFTIDATLNSNEFIVTEENGAWELIYSLTPTIRHNGTLYVPVRFLAAFLGYDVEWDAENDLVVLTSNGLHDRSETSEDGDESEEDTSEEDESARLDGVVREG